MNFDTIFDNAMKLYEAAPVQQQPQIDPKTGKPALQQPSGIQPPSGTPPVAGAGQQAPAAETPTTPTVAQPNITQAQAKPTNPAAPQQPAAQIKLSPEQSKMNAQQIMQSLAQAAGPQGQQVIQQMLAQLQQPK